MTSDVAVDWPHRVAILGVGLLGGSVALAIRRAKPGTRIVGLARSEEKRRQLQSSGLVDQSTTSLEEACRDCDVIVIASPVNQIAAITIAAASSCPDTCLITDVGSTKGGIVQQVGSQPHAAKKFVAAHPIAGSEKSGFRHALPTLFDGRTVVITPTAETDAKRLAEAIEFWELTGGVIKQMSPAQHDAHLAAISHVPHLVSALVARQAEPDARPLVGSGWADMTRVAAGDPELWTAICQENRTAIAHELDRLATELKRLRDIVDDENDELLKSWLAEAKRVKELTN